MHCKIQPQDKIWNTFFWKVSESYQLRDVNMQIMNILTKFAY